MNGLDGIGLFDYCAYAQSLKARREAAWRVWHPHHGETCREEFDAAWRAARASEKLRRLMQPGLSRPA